ncbi:MAG: isoprenylcysteine carboxylmethyltransferase family protein [Anaerolineaceae bacterium]|nr:isoprenylcysteine carboxylmethyltransferase family protein [Anaerolineaceae bacterium]
MTTTTNNKKLFITVLARLVLSIPVLGLVFFLPAGTLRYWQAWMYMSTLFTPMFVVLAYLLKNDPELLERRMRTKEKESRQNLIIKLSYPVFLIAFLMPGFDQRFSWSNMPAIVAILADVVVFSGYMMFFAVLRENSYASRVVEVAEEQKVISTGPYALVRHPMYLAVLLMYGCSPLALGSYWALIPISGIIPVLVARIKNEEEVLLRDLPGYAAYQQKTRFRMIPGIW